MYNPFKIDTKLTKKTNRVTLKNRKRHSMYFFHSQQPLIDMAGRSPMIGVEFLVLAETKKTMHDIAALLILYQQTQSTQSGLFFLEKLYFQIARNRDHARKETDNKRHAKLQKENRKNIRLEKGEKMKIISGEKGIDVGTHKNGYGV